MVCSDVARGGISVTYDLQNHMGYAPDVNMYLNSEKLRSLGWNVKVRMVDAYERLVRYLKESTGTNK